MIHGLDIYVVYRSPSEYPGEYVVRVQTVLGGGEIKKAPEPFGRFKTIGRVRRVLSQRGLFCMPRMKGDAPCIVETWI